MADQKTVDKSMLKRVHLKVLTYAENKNDAVMLSKAKTTYRMWKAAECGVFRQGGKLMRLSPATLYKLDMCQAFEELIEII